MDKNTNIWHKSQKALLAEFEMTPHETQTKHVLLKNKEPLVIADYPFEAYFKFPEQKGLSEITYIFKAPQNELRNACLKVHEYLTNQYGKHNHQNQRLESVGESDSSFKMIYVWNTLKQDSFEQACLRQDGENIIKITLFPKWELFECVLHTASHQHAQKYYFYLDKYNQQARPFEKSKIAPPLSVKQQKGEIIFSNKEGSYQAKMLETNNQLSIKVISPQGQIKIMQGFCYKR